jgi:hypothetical protein
MLVSTVIGWEFETGYAQGLLHNYIHCMRLVMYHYVALLYGRQSNYLQINKPKLLY